MVVMGSGMHEAHSHPLLGRGQGLTRRKRLLGHVGACLAHLDPSGTSRDLPTPWKAARTALKAA